MAIKKVVLTIAALLVVGALLSVSMNNKVRHIVELKSPWQKTYAQAKGELGAIQGFPYVFNYFLLYSWGQDERAVDTDSPIDTLNNFFHFRTLTDADYRDGGTPNNDTLYSVCWLYVEDEPVILSIPVMDTPERYFTFEFAAFNSDNYAYAGTRTTGSDGGHYAIVPYGWEGNLPEGVQLLARAPTHWSFLLGRTLVSDEADLPNVHALQDQYTLTALSDWGSPEHRRPAHPPMPNLFPDYTAMFSDKQQGFRAVLKKLISESPEDYAVILNTAMEIGGVARHEQSDMDQYREIGLGAGLDSNAINPEYIPGRNEGLALGLRDVVTALKTGYGTESENGWRIIDPSYGRAGDKRQYLLRASLQSLGGIVANDAAEAVYIVLSDDPNQAGVKKPSGKYSYTLHFSKKDLPEVDAFWSISMYDSTNNLVANPLNRYSLGDRSSFLSYDEDGGLTLYISHKTPGEDKEGNWLPAPAEEFYLVLRAYLPGPDIVEQRWSPPALNIVGP